MAIDTIGGYIETANDYIGNLETLVSSGKEGRHHAAALLEILTDSMAVEELNLPGLEPRSLKPNKDRPASERPSLSAVYPNPAVGEFYITYVLPTDRASAYIRIFDLQGKLVHTEDITKGFGILPLNVSHFAQGNYIYDLVLNGEKVESGKFNIHK